MEIDLVSMSRKDLMKLQSDVGKALKAAEQKDRLEALKAAERAVAEYGFTLDEVNAMPRKATSGRGAGGQPKYRNPADPEQTWSGHGRKPGWIHEALAKGHDITDLKI